MTYEYEPPVAPCERCGLAFNCSCTDGELPTYPRVYPGSIVARNAVTDEPQTALLLTQQEWDDLCDMVRAWTQPVVTFDARFVEETARRVALAERIIEANQ